MKPTHLMVERGADAPRPASGRDPESLWFALSRREWTSLVVVPADRAGSSAKLAAALAEAGRRLSIGPISTLSFAALDQDPHVLDDLHQTIQRARQGALLRTPSPERIIISIPAVVGEPRGLGVAQAADAVVVTIELGRTRLADARRTIELIGRESIAGCCIVR